MFLLHWYAQTLESMAWTENPDAEQWSLHQSSNAWTLPEPSSEGPLYKRKLQHFLIVTEIHWLISREGECEGMVENYLHSLGNVSFSTVAALPTTPHREPCPHTELLTVAANYRPLNSLFHRKSKIWNLLLHSPWTDFFVDLKLELKDLLIGWLVELKQWRSWD